LRPQSPSSSKRAFEPSEGERISAVSAERSVDPGSDSALGDRVVETLDEASGREHVAEQASQLDRNPRYSVRLFHSRILPDDRAVSVYLPPQYMEDE
jgi:hypothetical protein